MKKYLILFFVAAAAVFPSCNNNDDLWDAIDDLKSRVQALETQVNALNGNVEALQTLYGGATISEVTQTDGTYLITLTNGQTLTLAQGSEAEAVIPVISIDGDGFWQVSTDGGKSFTSLGVKALAEDGRTPQFRVDEATGYWQVSYDGGASYTNVLDTADQPVSAVGSGEVTDKFFEAVRVEEGNLYVKLLGGEELLIPIVEDFFCRILTPTEGVQLFDAGVTKRFTVEIRGVESTLVTAPEGWTARLTEPVGEKAELVVTAPGMTAVSAMQTRATADSSQDVSILASTGRYSCIAKIQVESTGAQAEVPTISIVSSPTVAPTASTLTFDVTLSDRADGWKYICQQSDVEQIPDAAKILAEGTAVSGTSVTVDGLEAGTSYTIHAVAYTGDLTSEVATATASTTAVPADPNDYYESGVEIEGVIYSKESEGVKLVEATDPETILGLSSNQYVYFLDGGEAGNAVAVTLTDVYRESGAAFIGRNAERKTRLNLKTEFHLRNKDAVFAFKNLEIDMTEGTSNQLFTFSNPTAGAKSLIFEDCDITFGNDKGIVSTYSGSPATTSVGTIIFRNCKLRYVPKGNASYVLIKLTPVVTSGLAEFKTLIFENNIFYTQEGASLSSPVSLLYQEYQDPASGSLSNLDITCRNNTFVDFLSFGSTAPGSAYFFLSQYGSMEFTKNVLYATAEKYVSIMRVTYDYNTNMPWPTTDLGKTENIVYGTKGWKFYFDGTQDPMSYYPEKGTYSKKTESPLSTNDPVNGRFVVRPEYAGYGSTLE